MSEEQVGSSNRGVAMPGSNNTHGRNRKTIEKKNNLQIINWNYKPCKTKQKKLSLKEEIT